MTSPSSWHGRLDRWLAKKQEGGLYTKWRVRTAVLPHLTAFYHNTWLVQRTIGGQLAVSIPPL